MRVPLDFRAWCVALSIAAALAFASPVAAKANGEDSTVREKLTLALRLPSREACDAIEKLLESDAPEADRQACLRELAKRYPTAAAPATPDEARSIDELRRRSQPVSDVLVGRFAIVLATEEFARGTRESNLLVWIDLVYAVSRNLFGYDPIAATGRRLIVFPDRDLTEGWRFDSTSFAIAVGRDVASYGTWRHALARELTAAFAFHHPAHYLFGRGFAAGWAEFGPAFVAQRLAFFEGPFRDKFEASRKEFASSARAEYLDTRLPIEQIPGPSAVPGLLMQLALLDAPDPSTPDWRPFQKLFRDAQRSPAHGVPVCLWPARMTRDVQRAFGADRVRGLLGEYRFPLDAFAAAEVERFEKRAGATKPSARDAKQTEGEIVLRGWRVLGPFPDPKRRQLDLDPLDAPNFRGGDTALVGGEAHAWRDDVALDENGAIRMAAGETPAVVYLATTWPDALSKPASLWIASSGPAAVWVGGELVHRSRETQGLDPDAAARVFLPKIAAGAPVLVQIATDGQPARLLVRAGGATPFDYAYRVEVRSPDASRRLVAARTLGSRRRPAQPLIELLAVALGDNDREVRAAAAKSLAGWRNEGSVIEALIGRWDTEKDSLVTTAIQAALEEISFVRFDSSAAAHKWWRGEDAKRWKQSYFVECEAAAAFGTLVGGNVAGSPAAFGNACVAGGFGDKLDDVLGVVLEARAAAPYVLRLRYTCARENGKIALGVRRGERTVFLREGIELPRTRDWNGWAWIEVPLGEMEPGRYRVEILLPNGRVDCDVVGWVVGPESGK